MHIEQLDSRRMFAVGLDPSFAGDGVLEAASNASIEATLSTPDATFVEQSIGGTHYVYKYSPNGAADVAWGDGGRVSLFTDVTHLAVDSSTGDLYAAGVDSRNDGTRATLIVYRFLANGDADGRFGNAGNTQYTIAASGLDQAKSTTYSAVLQVSQLLALPGRQVMVGFTRAIQAYYDIGVQFSTTITGSVGLMRFRYNGLIDRTFGGGYVPLLSTSSHSATTEFSVDGTRARTDITDLDLLPGNTYRAILTRETGVLHDTEFNLSDGLNSSFEIKSRLISGTGQISTAEAYSWNLLKSTSETTHRQFLPLLAQADGRSGVTVIGRYDFSATATAPAEPLRAIKLAPGLRNAVSSPFSDTGIVYTHAARNDHGFYYLADDDGHVARYRPQFGRDINFARRGVGASDHDTIDYTLVPDTSGAILLISRARVERFA